MTTFLIALRFAVNIEDRFTQLQRERFRHTGDASARVLPPIVPIVCVDHPVAEQTLDAIRRRHVVCINPDSNPTERSESAPIAAAYHLQNEGYPALRTALCDTLRPSETIVPGLTPVVEEAATLRIGWTDEPALSRSIFPARTCAIWLTMFEITIDSSGETPHRWWNGARWDLRFSRRLATPR